MPIPMSASIQLPLLRVIADAGGELRLQDALARVEAFFPELTEEDKQRLQSSGKDFTFRNRVRWARMALVQQGYLYREPKGLWRITPQGRSHLEEHWPSWQPRYSTGEAGRAAREVSATGKPRGQGEPDHHAPAPEIPTLRPHGCVFEVQDRGNLIEALAKLQHAKDMGKPPFSSGARGT